MELNIVVNEVTLFVVDAEGNHKTELKYKCHTMKKLSMTRTLLTEKKEGEENIGWYTSFPKSGDLDLILNQSIRKHSLSVYSVRNFSKDWGYKEKAQTASALKELVY